MAPNYSFLSWVPPLIDQWDFTDCSPYARFSSTLFRRNVENDVSDLCAIDVEALHAYVLSSLPAEFQASGHDLTSRKTAYWYLSNCGFGLSTSRDSTFPDQCSKDQYFKTAGQLRNKVYDMLNHNTCVDEMRAALDIDEISVTFQQLDATTSKNSSTGHGVLLH